MWISIPTEQTTAWTDLILTILALACLIAIKGIAKPKPIWTSAWIGVFGLLALASFLGALAHGIQWTPQILSTLWFGIYSCLSLAMALVAVATITFQWGHRVARKLFSGAIVNALLFLSITQTWSDSFLLFLLYEGFILLAALGVFSSLFFFRRVPGTGLIALELR